MRERDGQGFAKEVMVDIGDGRVIARGVKTGDFEVLRFESFEEGEGVKPHPPMSLD